MPPQLLLDIKKLAAIEDGAESLLRDVFDEFDQSIWSAMAGFMSPSESARNKVSRVTFNSTVKPLIDLFPGRDSTEIYSILNAYLSAVAGELAKKSTQPLLSKPVVFRAFLGIFRFVAQRVVDKFGADYTPDKFQAVIAPIFPNIPMKKIEQPGPSWAGLRDYLENKMKSKLTL